jgi:ADP-ribosylation factor-like protein 8
MQSMLVANPTMLNSELATTPLLVLANKIDLEPHISEPELIRELNLDYIVDNPWLVIPISALRLVNIDQVIQWLMKQSGKG